MRKLYIRWAARTVMLGILAFVTPVAAEPTLDEAYRVQASTNEAR